MDKIRISIDEENNAEEWWEAAMDAEKQPAGFAEIFQSPTGEIIVTHEAALAIRDWMESLPGYDTGPEFARYPLIFCPVDDGEA